MSRPLHLLILPWLLCPLIGYAQDIEDLINTTKSRMETSPLSISGGIQSSLQWYQLSGDIDNRATPLLWQARAHMQVDFLGVKVPISSIFSTRSVVFDYDLPAFAFAGMSPSYKWATLHLGDRTMHFSPYSFSGHNFRGVGTELKPGNFRFSAFYGQLKRARVEDLGKLQNIESPYRRIAWGFKTGFDNGRDELAVSLFSASDDAESIDLPTDSLVFQPAENVVLGFNGKKHFGKVVYLTVDFAHSIFTKNQNSTLRFDVPNFFQKAGGLIKPLTSTNYNNAIKTQLGFQANFGTLELTHERIDPGYRSLGTLFFNNDLENFTGGITTSLFKRKVRLTGQLGVQRNNLSGDQNNSSTRIVGNVNANANVGSRLNLNLTYSNFSNTNRLKSMSNPLQPIDSIVLVLVNENVSLGGTYQLSQEQTSVLSMLLMYQEASSIQNDEIDHNQFSRFWLAQVAHQYQTTSTTTGITSALQLNYGVLPQTTTLTVGPSIGINAALFKDKLRPNSTLSFTANNVDGKWIGNMLSWQNRLSYALHGSHRFSIISAFIKRTSNLSNVPAFAEWRFRMEYAWAFN